MSSVPLVRNQNVELAPPQVANEADSSILRPMLGVAATVGLIAAVYFGSWIAGVASGICLLYLLLTCCCCDAKPLTDRNVQGTQGNGLSFPPQANSANSGSASTNRTFTTLSSSGQTVPPLPAESLALLQARSAGAQAAFTPPPPFNPASFAFTSTSSGSSALTAARGATSAPASSVMFGTAPASATDVLTGSGALNPATLSSPVPSSAIVFGTAPSSRTGTLTGSGLTSAGAAAAPGTSPAIEFGTAPISRTGVLTGSGSTLSPSVAGSTGWFTRVTSWFSSSSSSSSTPQAASVVSAPIRASEQVLLDQLPPEEPVGSQSRVWSNRRRDVVAYTRLLNTREQLRRDLSHIQGLPAPTGLIHDIGRIAHLDFPKEFRNIRAEIDRLRGELSLARQQRLGMPASTAPSAPAATEVVGDQFYVDIP